MTTEEINESEGADYGATVLDVLEAVGASLIDVVDVARVTSIGMEEMRSTRFGSIDALQLRDMSVTLRRSPDELLAIAEAPEAEIDRRKAIVRARQDLQDAAAILQDRARGAAHLMRQMCDGDGIGMDRAAALDLLADSLEDAAESVSEARDALTEHLHG